MPLARPFGAPSRFVAAWRGISENARLSLNVALTAFCERRLRSWRALGVRTLRTRAHAARAAHALPEDNLRSCSPPLQQWLAGLPAVFPAGTYKMRGKPGVVIQE